MSESKRELGAIRNLQQELEDLAHALEHRLADSGNGDRPEEETAAHHVRIKALTAVARWRSTLHDQHPHLARIYDATLAGL